MEQKAMLHLETVKNDRRYTLAVPIGSPYSECFEFLVECQETLREMANLAEEQAKALAEQVPLQEVQAEVVNN